MLAMGALEGRVTVKPAAVCWNLTGCGLGPRRVTRSTLAAAVESDLMEAGPFAGIARSECVQVAVGCGEAEVRLGDLCARAGRAGVRLDGVGLVGGRASAPVGRALGGDAGAFAHDAPGAGVVDAFAVGFEPFADGKEGLLLDLGDAAVSHGRDVEHEVAALAGDAR